MTTLDQDQLPRIGAVTERVSLSLHTVRYYDEVGLVRPSARTEGGFRLYSEDDILRLRVVKRMKPLGLALEEMRELLLVRIVDRLTSCDEAARDLLPATRP